MPSPATRLDVRRVAWLPLVVDLAAWLSGLLAVLLTASPVRGDLTLSLAVAVFLGAAIQAVMGVANGLYRARRDIGSFDEAVLLMITVSVSAAGAALADRPWNSDSASPLVLASSVAAMLLMLTARFVWRRLHERRHLARLHDGQRTIIYGAGEGGYQVLRSLLRESQSLYHPIALIDDAPSKRGCRIMGVPVVGDRTALVEVARRTDATVLLVAIPSASGQLIDELSKLGRVVGLHVKVVPSVYALISGQARMGDIRDVNIADVLGRPSSPMDPRPMASYLIGKKVLVTGAGGSIGSELCRVLSRLGPSQLLMLDRDESALHALQLSIEGRAMLDSPSVILADIRDRQALVNVFDRHRPDVVFHAAALKHLPLLEKYPDEAIKSNVWGTLNVLAAANGISRLVNISTDKAADPISVLGTSKRIAERLVASGRPGTTCVSVRFGNVLGSRGSVLHTFAAQAKSGGPLTVTHPDATRYFMTVTEAVNLVIAAGGIGADGEVLVLDMGEPARILDVARMVAGSPKTPIEFTGLRRGEKLHEQLFGEGEVDSRPIHPLVSHVTVPALGPHMAYALGTDGTAEEVAARLAELTVAGDPLLERSRYENSLEKQNAENRGPDIPAIDPGTPALRS